MRKIPVIITIVLLSIHINKYQAIAEKTDAPNEQPDYKLIYDTLLTTLDPSIEKEIINYYGYVKQYGLYDAKILSIERHEGQFGFIVKVQVTTFEHAHDPPNGKEIMISEIDPSGVKTISFQHEGDQLEKDINEFYKVTLSDIKKSFQLNLDTYTSYIYNQLQYQAEINDEFKSLFAIAEEIAINILIPERKIPNKNVIDPVTFINGDTGYLLFKKSDGTNVMYKLQKKDGSWIVTDKKSKQGKKMDDKIPWYI
ncbi:DUF3888 domain-containing protein [Solibacillus sp. FSL K6-1523]|uniref:DUF3888 domain-containing protein n=1 Tax=Solibacillus sp. FSL K6-1523 TaxID=2921471 RepID=UPI0030FC5863